MKKTLNFIAAILLVFSAVFSANAQTKKRVKIAAKNKIVWETTQINKYGVVSLALPKKYGKGVEETTSHKNSEVVTESYSMSWAIKNPKTFQTTFTFDLRVNQWNKDFSVVTENKPEFATPENLMMIDYNADLKNMEKNDNPGVIYEDVSLLEIDGLKGSYFRAKFRNNGKKMTGRQTYRYFNSVPQRISLSSECSGVDCDTVLEIFKTLKFIKTGV
jgi:hypothetical protein